MMKGVYFYFNALSTINHTKGNFLKGKSTYINKSTYYQFLSVRYAEPVFTFSSVHKKPVFATCEDHSHHRITDGRNS